MPRARIRVAQKAYKFVRQKIAVAKDKDRGCPLTEQASERIQSLFSSFC
jgi:hypothetical protein